MVIFRPHNVYGPNMGYEHVIPELISKIKVSKKNIKIQGSGREERSFIYIDDFCNAFDKILKKGKHLNIYSIGNSKSISITNLAKIIMKNMKKNLKIFKSKRTRGSTLKRCPNISKIRKLGYRQKTSLEDGIKKTIQWYT